MFFWIKTGYSSLIDYDMIFFSIQSSEFAKTWIAKKNMIFFIFSSELVLKETFKMELIMLPLNQIFLIKSLEFEISFQSKVMKKKIFQQYDASNFWSSQPNVAIMNSIQTHDIYANIQIFVYRVSQKLIKLEM